MNLREVHAHNKVEGRIIKVFFLKTVFSVKEKKEWKF